MGKKILRKLFLNRFKIYLYLVLHANTQGITLCTLFLYPDQGGKIFQIKTEKNLRKLELTAILK